MALKQFEPKKIYIRVNAQPITTSGIYHNEDLGLISLSSDGSNWITIADKNLGASAVYNPGDTLSEANCGKYYQWGNNYGFPFTGSVTTSSTKVTPTAPYSSSIFITNNSSEGTWGTSSVYFLWGGNTSSLTDKQGPCDAGYHIPTEGDFNSIISMGTSLGLSNIFDNLLFPKAGQRYYTDGTIGNQGSSGLYWTSTFSSGTNEMALYSASSLLLPSGEARAFSIRPFANTPTQPDDSRTKLY